MADDLDAVLQGNDAPQASPAINSQQSDPAQDTTPTGQQSDEEVEFNQLSGSAQERIRNLVTRARQAEEEAERLRSQQYYAAPPPAPASNMITPDQQTAVQTLSKFGIATDEKVDQKISEGFNYLRWEMENSRLESKYNGGNGEPQYVKEEVEDYINKHPQYRAYAPEDVFRFKMFPDEFANLGTQTPRKPSSSVRPTKAQVVTSTITPDNVEEMVRTHSQDWYNEHVDEINQAVSAHTKRFNRQGEMV